VLNKITVFGVGLIGGSFALALKQAGAVKQIVGIDCHAQALARAQVLDIIDATMPLADALRDTDLVLVAAPVGQTQSILTAIEPHLQSRTVVTDVGSTKSDVVQAARRALDAKVAQFIPAHPIAGREFNGPEAAISDLYIGKKVVLTPLVENRPDDIERVVQVWQQCGACIHYLSPQEHDRIFAAVSHLPHMLAYALVDEIAQKSHANVLFQYAASGFRDFTRIAASSAPMWRDIALANQEALLLELDAYLAQLNRLRSFLAASDGSALQAMFANAQDARQNWLKLIEPKKGSD